MARVVRNFDDGDGQIDKDELRVGLKNYLGKPSIRVRVRVRVRVMVGLKNYLCSHREKGIKLTFNPLTLNPLTLNPLGFEMEKQNFDHVWEYFDDDKSGHISVAEFLHGIRGNLNKKRLLTLTLTLSLTLTLISIKRGS